MAGGLAPRNREAMLSVCSCRRRHDRPTPTPTDRTTLARDRPTAGAHTCIAPWLHRFMAASLHGLRPRHPAGTAPRFGRPRTSGSLVDHPRPPRCFVALRSLHAGAHACARVRRRACAVVKCPRDVRRAVFERAASARQTGRWWCRVGSRLSTATKQRPQSKIGGCGYAPPAMYAAPSTCHRLAIMCHRRRGAPAGAPIKI